MKLRRQGSVVLCSAFLCACQARSTSSAVSVNAPVQQHTRADKRGPASETPLTIARDAQKDEVNDSYDDGSDGLGDEANEGFDNDEPDAEPEEPPVLAATSRHPLDALTDEELERRLERAPLTLGSVSLGRPNAGGLFNGVAMPADEAWKLVDPAHAYGTQETIDTLRLSLRAVYEHFPNTPVVSIGHLSAKQGGHLRPHRSHQSGRDVDISFYYDGAPNLWYARAKPDNLDLARTMYLFRTLVEKTNIEMILIDQSLHGPLRRYALDQGMDPAWVEGLFSTREGRPPIVRHAPGHTTHLHLRFRNPTAERSGQRLAALLAKHRLAVVPPKTIVHVARDGDTLAKLATRYATSMHAIRVQNGMPNTQLVAGRTYQIPVVSSSPQGGSRGQNTASAHPRSAKK